MIFVILLSVTKEGLNKNKYQLVDFSKTVTNSPKLKEDANKTLKNTKRHSLRTENGIISFRDMSFNLNETVFTPTTTLTVLDCTFLFFTAAFLVVGCLDDKINVGYSG